MPEEIKTPATDPDKSKDPDKDGQGGDDKGKGGPTAAELEEIKTKLAASQKNYDEAHATITRTSQENANLKKEVDRLKGMVNSVLEKDPDRKNDDVGEPQSTEELIVEIDEKIAERKANRYDYSDLTIAKKSALLAKRNEARMAKLDAKDADGEQISEVLIEAEKLGDKTFSDFAALGKIRDERKARGEKITLLTAYDIYQRGKEADRIKEAEERGAQRERQALKARGHDLGQDSLTKEEEEYQKSERARITGRRGVELK